MRYTVVNFGCAKYPAAQTPLPNLAMEDKFPPLESDVQTRPCRSRLVEPLSRKQRPPGLPIPVTVPKKDPILGEPGCEGL